MEETSHKPEHSEHAHHDQHAHSHSEHSEHPKTHPHKLPAYSAIPDLENWLEEYLGQKAPQLPEAWRKTIAKIGPWVTLILFIFTIPLILAALGLAAAVTPFTAAGIGYSWGVWNSIILLITAASLVLEIMALPGLFKRAKQGWVYIFYAALLSGAANILDFNLGSILGTILSLYIIFQIKNQYK